jgi:hypothetical protein
MRGNGAGDGEVDHAGLDHRATVGEVNLDDTVQPAGADHHRRVERQAAAAEARAGAARHERHAVAVQDAHDRRRLLRGTRQHHRIRHLLGHRPAVALVDARLARPGDQRVVADDVGQRVEHLLGEHEL